jgi:hypothetical protein
MITNENFANFDFYLKDIHEVSNRCKLINENIEKLRTSLRKVKWEDMNLIVVDEGNKVNLEIHFGEENQILFTNIMILVGEPDYTNAILNNLKEQLGCEKELFCPAQIDVHLNNRIDINGGGIPPICRNLGLGKKIYRKILQDYRYITSVNDKTSMEAKLMWNSLRKDKMFSTFFYKNGALCFRSDEDPTFIIGKLEKLNNNLKLESLLWDENFKNENTELIQSSGLSKL